MTEPNTALAETTPAATALAKLSIKDTVLAQFKEAEATVTALAERYRSVVYDVTTTKGMKEAIAARADLRDNGRLMVTKAETSVKAEVNELKRVMSDEVERIVAIVKPVEDSIDAQIKAEDKRKADEKAEKDRIEAERVAVHRENLDRLKSYVTRAEGQPVEAVEKAITTLEALTFGAEWEEFQEQAALTRDSTVMALMKLVAAEKQKAENERLQRELAEARAALAERDAKEAKEAAEAKARADQAEADRLAQEQRAAEEATARQLTEQTIQQAAAPEPKPTPAPTLAPVAVATPRYVPHMAASTPAPTPAPTTGAPAEPMLKLGQIAERLGFMVTAELLSMLGFEARVERMAKLYPESEFAAICFALVEHINAVAMADHTEAA